MWDNFNMKDLNNKWLIRVGTIIYLIGFSLAVICLFMMFAGVKFVFEREEWLIPAGVSYITGNLINFALYMAFKTQNVQKLKEIEDEYVSQVEAGMPLINWITWDPFSMKGYKMRYLKNNKKWDDNESRQETIASFHVVVWNTLFLRPLYIMFLFSISSRLKLKAIEEFESKNTQK